MNKIRPLQPIVLMTVLLIGVSPLMLPSFADAIPVEQIPHLNQQAGLWVSDRANLLSPQGIKQISDDIAKLEAETGAEIAIVTVPDTVPYPTPKAYTTTLFNRWKIGKKDRDNGVLILVSLKDRRVEIETGYGVQGFLSNAQVKDIIHTYMIPSFKKGNYEEGIRAGTTVLSGFLRGAYTLGQTKFKPQIEISILDFVLAILIAGVFFPTILIVYLIYCRSAFVGGDGSRRNSDSCGYDGGGGNCAGGDFGGGSSGGDGGGGDW
jgi:uncharacterized protein